MREDQKLYQPPPSSTSSSSSSSRQSDEEYFQQVKIESRRRFRRNTGFLSAALLILIVILALIGSSQILLVSILYLSILLEGICLAMFVTNYDVNWGVESLSNVIMGRRRRNERESSPRGRDVASSMSVFVRYAAQGSDYSRREVAMTLKHMLEKSGVTEDVIASGKIPAELKNDILRVVYAYTDQEDAVSERRLGSSAGIDIFGVRRRVSRREREAYLDRLERIVKYIESI